MTRPIIFLCLAANSRWCPALESTFGSLLPHANANTEGLKTWHEQVVLTRAKNAHTKNDRRTHSHRLANSELSGLLAMAPDTGRPWGGTMAGMSWAVEDLLVRIPQGRCVVLAETPSQALSDWLQAGSGTDPQDILDDWMESARRVVSSVQRSPAQFRVVYRSDLELRPEAFGRLVAEWLGTDFDESATVVEPPDSGAAALETVAELLASRHTKSQRLCEQLFACSTPLAVDSPVLGAASGLPELEQGLAQLRGWALDAPQLAHVKKELDARARETAVKEPLFIDALARASANEAEVDTLLAVLATERCDLSDAREEADLMRVQLHQVFGELERFYRAANGEDPGDRMPSEGVILRVERADFGLQRDTPPHREFEFSLFDVRGENKTIVRLDLRLVEHHGRPGLVLLSNADGSMPLANWQPAGEESGRTFMLLIPGDETGCRKLMHMGSSDWLFMQALARTVEQEALANAELVPLRWRTTAMRLRAQIDSFEPRFRYDAVDVAAATDKDLAFMAIFQNPIFGERKLVEVRLGWRTAGPLPEVELCGPVDIEHSSLLCSWPVTDGGVWQPRWVVPLGNIVASRESLHEWLAMPETDRQLVLAILDALPAVAARISELDIAEKFRWVQMVNLSRLHFEKGRAAINGSMLRRVARAVRRRFGSYRSPSRA